MTESPRTTAWRDLGASADWEVLPHHALGARPVPRLERLACTEQGVLLNEAGGRRERMPEQVLRAIAEGCTKFSEIKTAVGTEPTRPIKALRDLDLIQRIQPIGTKPDTRRACYRINDNFLDFWLSQVEPFRELIVAGIGSDVEAIIDQRFGDFMRTRWEEAFRAHLAIITDQRIKPIAGIGEFWKQSARGDENPCQIDAVGRNKVTTLVGEAKWAVTPDGGDMLRGLKRKAMESGLRLSDNLMYAVCARENITHLPTGHDDILVVTAADIFG